MTVSTGVGPLLLAHVPTAIQHMYHTLTQFITEECGLSIRYINGDVTPGSPADMLRSTVRDALSNNDSLRLRQTTWKLNSQDQIAIPEDTFAKYPTAGPANTVTKLKFQREMDGVSLESKLADIDQISGDVLNDKYGLLKLVGLDVVRPGSDAKVMIPLWGWGVSAAEAEHFEDREIKFIFSDERINSEQLITACFLHSLIEAGWWHPLNMLTETSKYLPQTASDDNKRFVSCIIDENVAYWSMSAVALVERLQLFDQHFEDKQRSHTPNGCTCQRIKSYNRSFCMKKVSSIKQMLTQSSLDTHELHRWFNDHIETAGGPDDVLRLYLDILRQSVEESAS